MTQDETQDEDEAETQDEDEAETQDEGEAQEEGRKIVVLDPVTVQQIREFGLEVGRAASWLWTEEKWPLSRITEVLKRASMVFYNATRQGLIKEVFKSAEGAQSAPAPSPEPPPAPPEPKEPAPERLTPLKDEKAKEEAPGKTHQCDDCGVVFRHRRGRLACPACGSSNVVFTRLLPEEERPLVNEPPPDGMKEEETTSKDDIRAMSRTAFAQDGAIERQMKEPEEEPKAEPPKDTKRLKEKRKPPKPEERAEPEPPERGERTELEILKRKLWSAKSRKGGLTKNKNIAGIEKIDKVIEETRKKIAELEGKESQ